MVCVINIDDFYPIAFSLLLRAARCRHTGEFEAFLLCPAAQFIYEEFYSGTGAEAGNHTVPDQLCRLYTGCFLQFILCFFIHSAPFGIVLWSVYGTVLMRG